MTVFVVFSVPVIKPHRDGAFSGDDKLWFKYDHASAKCMYGAWRNDKHITASDGHKSQQGFDIYVLIDGLNELFLSDVFFLTEINACIIFAVQHIP